MEYAMKRKVIRTINHGQPCRKMQKVNVDEEKSTKEYSEPKDIPEEMEQFIDPVNNISTRMQILGLTAKCKINLDKINMNLDDIYNATKKEKDLKEKATVTSKIVKRNVLWREPISEIKIIDNISRRSKSPISSSDSDSTDDDDDSSSTDSTNSSSDWSDSYLINDESLDTSLDSESSFDSKDN